MGGTVNSECLYSHAIRSCCLFKDVAWKRKRELKDGLEDEYGRLCVSPLFPVLTTTHTPIVSCLDGCVNLLIGLPTVNLLTCSFFSTQNPEQLLKTPNMILSRTCLNTLQPFLIGLRSKILHEGPPHPQPHLTPSSCRSPSTCPSSLLSGPPVRPASSCPGPLHMLSQLAVSSSPDSWLATFCSAFCPQLKYHLPQEASPESRVDVVVASVPAPALLAWHLSQSVIIY